MDSCGGSVMDDYIDLLLADLGDHSAAWTDGAYYVQRSRERQAQSALWETLSPPQQSLFLEYEEERNASASLHADALARQAFLLARRIFR